MAKKININDDSTELYLDLLADKSKLIIKPQSTCLTQIINMETEDEKDSYIIERNSVKLDQDSHNSLQFPYL